MSLFKSCSTCSELFFNSVTFASGYVSPFYAASKGVRREHDKNPPKTNGTEYDPTGGDFLSGHRLFLTAGAEHIPLQPSKAEHRMREGIEQWAKSREVEQAKEKCSGKEVYFPTKTLKPLSL